jgi:hypothetical protein
VPGVWYINFSTPLNGALSFRPAKNRAIRSNFCPFGAKIPLLSLALLKNGLHAIFEL